MEFAALISSRLDYLSNSITVMQNHHLIVARMQRSEIRETMSAAIIERG